MSRLPRPNLGTPSMKTVSYSRAIARKSAGPSGAPHSSSNLKRAAPPAASGTGTSRPSTLRTAEAAGVGAAATAAAQRASIAASASPPSGEMYTSPSVPACSALRQRGGAVVVAEQLASHRGVLKQLATAVVGVGVKLEHVPPLGNHFVPRLGIDPVELPRVQQGGVSIRGGDDHHSKVLQLGKQPLQQRSGGGIGHLYLVEAEQAWGGLRPCGGGGGGAAHGQDCLAIDLARGRSMLKSYEARCAVDDRSCSAASCIITSRIKLWKCTRRLRPAGTVAASKNRSMSIVCRGG